MLPRPVVEPRRSVLCGLAAAVAFATAGCGGATEAAAPRPSPSAAALPGSLPAGHPPIGDAPSGQRPAGHPPVGDTAESVAGTVELSPSLASRAQGAAALFLIARSAKDRRILAVRKDEAGGFPHRFQLSSADAMSQSGSFGGPVEVTARLSRTGDAAPGPGDLEGRAAGVEPGATAVRITLDRVLP